MTPTIREERPTDIVAVRAINLAAFPTEAEANLVDAIRGNGNATLSLVATDGDRVVGHILFSPVTVDSNPGGLMMVGLAPMAVLPELQRQGVGSSLVEAGLERCREMGVAAVVVLGHDEYYPRFGFEVASGHGIGCEYDVPERYFMVVGLKRGVLEGVSGVVRYLGEFGGV